MKLKEQVEFSEATLDRMKKLSARVQSGDMTTRDYNEMVNSQKEVIRSLKRMLALEEISNEMRGEK